MHVLAPYLVSRCRHDRPLKVVYRLAGKPEVALHHGLMPGKLTIVDPPCPCWISFTYPVQVQVTDFR